MHGLICTEELALWLLSLRHVFITDDSEKQRIAWKQKGSLFLFCALLHP